ncbi:MAG TPA: putative inorganic carbon transporter subunit DabA, partial [Planctomycetaceae bacterium]
ALYGQPQKLPDGWIRHLPAELRRMVDRQITPLESIHESLELLGVRRDEWEQFLSSTLLALRGWGGMLREVELRGDRVVRPVPPGSLVEFLAVRLLLDRFAAEHVARTAVEHACPLGELRDWLIERHGRARLPSVEQRAFLVFQLAQVAGLSPDVLHRLRRPEWSTIVREIEAFHALERRRIFHLAYECRFARQALDAIAIHAPQKRGRPSAPAFQLTCCLDEREESFRRHVEELAPDVETFGPAGFYSMAIYYRGAADAHFTPLCPVVVKPQHWVAEEVGGGQEATHLRRARTRRLLGAATHHAHRGSRTIASGSLLTVAGGVLATFPLVARILFPRVAGRIRKMLAHFVQPPPETRLKIERRETTCGPTGDHVGYSVDEMIAAAERLLRDMGLTSGFARLVLLLGHGSDSLNNPHNSAYNCGACGGAAGGPNARAMAHVLNDSRVREGLASRNLHVPADTTFVGGYHDTCNETVTFSDLDRVPDSHRDEFEQARKVIEAACDRNAHERCRRFMSAPLTLSFHEARQHVEERAEDLSQTRPELGHATNALTIVGRREWTRGLFLDRRAFLTSYDPTQDDAQSSILTGILQAVFPVCSGINLEYYFSRVDNAGYGAGTKLPHNLASLLGVMDGAASDLRTGLPWQMVEIHEPVRSLFIIETTAPAMLSIMDRQPGIGRLCRNGWIQLALLHPQTREVSVFHDGRFEPYETEVTTLPQAASSTEWYRGWRDHLEFCQIDTSTQD